jgi:hypothetical protein
MRGSKCSLPRSSQWHAILCAVAASGLQNLAVASAYFQLEDAVLDVITAEAGSQALASGGAFNAMTSPATILTTAPLGVDLIGSQAPAVGSILSPNPSPLFSQADSFPGLDTTQLTASSQAKASGEAVRTSTSTSTNIVPSNAAVAGSVTADTTAFAGPASALSDPANRFAASVTTTSQAAARGRLGAAGIALDFANVGVSSAREAPESRTDQRLQAIASGSFVTARAFFSATSCCLEVVREPTVKAAVNGPNTLRSGWSYLTVDGRRTNVFGSVFVLATDLRLTPSIADYSLRVPDVVFSR